ncbi:MAG: 2-oxo acid dehydrogenase subunit E2 [Clostridia bacterium]|nr:2-oxo acid dehydrogenase subunit E2 [Clostridia bacterium]
MKKAFRYKSSPLSPFVILSFLFCLVSFGTAVYRASLFRGEEGLFVLLLPSALEILAVALYGILILRKGGSAALTALPWLLYACFVFIRLLRESLPVILCGAAVLLILWILYEKTLRGRLAWRIPLLLLHFVLLAPALYLLFRKALPAERAEIGSIAAFLASVIFYLSGLHKEELPFRFRRRGDRADGRRIRSKPPMDNIAPYIMVSKLGAANQFRDEFEIAKAEKYILEKRKAGLKGFGLMHVLIAAYVRMLSEKPAINRFVAGQRLYTRDDEIEINLTVKKEMTEASPETVVKFFFNPRMTADEVYEVIRAEVEKNKTDVLDSGMDNAAAILNYVPGLLLKFTVWFLKLLDYFGLLPRALTKISPFHGTMFITSMGSLGVPPVQHHLYDFGNLPVFMAFGPKKKRNILQSDGTVKEKRYCEFAATVDDRICDGFTYAQAFKAMKRYVSDPYLLDEPPEKVAVDIE